MLDRSVPPHNGSDPPAGPADVPGVSANGRGTLTNDDVDGGSVERALTELTAVVGREHDRAAHREQIIDRLHEENLRLRHGEVQAAFEPVQSALYRLYDLVRREAARPEQDPAHVPALLGAIADEIVEVIERTGVEKLDVRPGEPYDAVRHRPVEIEETADRRRADTVAGVRRSGFARGDKVLRRAEVVIARAPAATKAAASEATKAAASEASEAGANGSVREGSGGAPPGKKEDDVGPATPAPGEPDTEHTASVSAEAAAPHAPETEG